MMEASVPEIEFHDKILFFSAISTNKCLRDSAVVVIVVLGWCYAHLREIVQSNLPDKISSPLPVKLKFAFGGNRLDIIPPDPDTEPPDPPVSVLVPLKLDPLFVKCRMPLGSKNVETGQGNEGKRKHEQGNHRGFEDPTDMQN